MSFVQIFPPTPAPAPVSERKPLERRPFNELQPGETLTPTPRAIGDLMARVAGSDAWALAGSGGGGGGAIPDDAPSDGQTYGRLNAAWAAIPPGTLVEPIGPGTWARLQTGAWQRSVALGGDTMTGLLNLSAHPIAASPPLQAATKQYVDNHVGAAYTWDVGLIEAPPGNIMLDTAGATVATRGGVGVPARSPTQGLLNTLGLLTAPLATPALAGSMVDCPADGEVYCRIDTGWIDLRLALGPPLNFRVGLTQTGMNVDLDPATATVIGGMTDAPADGRVYTRASGRWAPAALGAVFTHLAPITLLGDDTVNAAVPRYIVTVPRTALPDIAVVYSVSGGGIGTMFMSNVGAGPIGAVPGSMGWGFFLEEVFNSGNWIPAGAPGSLALLNVAEPTLVKAAGGTNRLLSYDPVNGNGIRIGFGMTGGTNAGFPPVSLFIGIEGQILFAA
jgi:hypothetical protein